ncbi:diguanylate cyclase [Pararhizobium capsulatum DSM 1112]|uniref:diguanylate cyclase n=1 Tax=Pararhizobium capsulatum DSM 1112 TaxID=1121113 RepID=A0ABU0BNF5_9HYPH|nr:GGDEF domain-containing protein [Pararhizobium capsulatum]MDQ0319784.1 diguanylate cyclase [Pararhizobium capsulatum DSM 1112]
MTNPKQNAQRPARTEIDAVFVRIAQAMASLGVSPLPRNYALFYEALSGRNPDLARELSALGPSPDAAKIDELGIRHNLASHATLSADKVQAQAVKLLGDVSVAMREATNRKTGFVRQLQDFALRLENDPVVAMSDFADATQAIRDQAAALLRDEASFSGRLTETVAQLSSMEGDIDALRAAATRDPSTGLPNRTAFSARLSALFLDAPPPTALVLVSLNGLRGVGERYGVDALEKALKKLAPIFRKSIKKNDFVGRIGLDELAFLFSDVSAANAEAIVSRIRASIEAIDIPLPERSFTPERLSLSAGIAMTDAASGEADLFSQAELALHAVKASGHPGQLVFSAAVGARSPRLYSPHAA